MPKADPIRPFPTVRQRLDQIQACLDIAEMLQEALGPVALAEGERASSTPDSESTPLVGQALWIASLSLLRTEDELLYLSNGIRAEHKIRKMEPSAVHIRRRQIVADLKREALEELKRRADESQASPQSC